MATPSRHKIPFFFSHRTLFHVRVGAILFFLICNLDAGSRRLSIRLNPSPQAMRLNPYLAASTSCCCLRLCLAKTHDVTFVVKLGTLSTIWTKLRRSKMNLHMYARRTWAPNTRFFDDPRFSQSDFGRASRVLKGFTSMESQAVFPVRIQEIKKCLKCTCDLLENDRSVDGNNGSKSAPPFISL